MGGDDPAFVFAPVHVTALVEEGGNTYEEALTPACDFCLDTRVRWEYPCADFEIQEILFGSVGEWLACERCSERIEAGDFGGLAARSANSWVTRHRTIEPEQLDRMGQIQHGFFDHRSGPRFPIEKGEQ